MFTALQKRRHRVKTAGALAIFLTAETNALKPEIYVSNALQRTPCIRITKTVFFFGPCCSEIQGITIVDNAEDCIPSDTASHPRRLIPSAAPL